MNTGSAGRCFRAAFQDVGAMRADTAQPTHNQGVKRLVRGLSLVTQSSVQEGS